MCPIINNSNTIELKVHTSCYWGLRLTLCYCFKRYFSVFLGQSIFKSLHKHKKNYLSTFDCKSGFCQPVVLSNELFFLFGISSVYSLLTYVMFKEEDCRDHCRCLAPFILLCFGKRGIFTRSPLPWVFKTPSFICYHVDLPRLPYVAVKNLNLGWHLLN